MNKADAHRTIPDAALRTPDYSRARNQMVDDQIRPLQVSDPRIIKAMRELPREMFVPAASAALAYADREVRLAQHRVLMEPRVIARLLQVSVPRMGEKALVVAAATGYAAALLRRLRLDVVALEPDEALAQQGATICAEQAPGVRFVRGALPEGWKPEAPYDLILIDGAVQTLPERFAEQLAGAGRVATVLRSGGHLGTAVLAEASNGGLRARPQFDAHAALIPELSIKPSFDF